MADLKVKISEFPLATESKDTDDIAILQDGVNKRIKTPKIEEKILDKVSERYVNKNQLGINNGVATLGNDGLLSLNQRPVFDVKANFLPINLLTPPSEVDGVFVPTESGVYENYGNIEIDLNEGTYIITKIGDEYKKSLLAVKSPESVDTIADLRLREGDFEGQIITLLGYYEAGDKEPLNYKWTSEQDVDDGGSIINTASGSWLLCSILNLHPEDFGAKGDGSTNDYIAFKQMNEYLFKLTYDLGTISAVNYSNNCYTINLNQSKKYFIKGDNVIGSIYANDVNTKNNTISFVVNGNGSTIIWEPLEKESCLININGFVERPKIKNINFFISNNTDIEDVYQGVLINLSSGYNGGVHGAGGLVLENVNTRPYNNVFFYKIINVMGSTQADTMRIIDCTFYYFYNVFYSDNQESVNNLFINCGFYGGTSFEKRYFEFTKMGDNFSVQNCNFSVSNNEVILYNRSNKDVNGNLLQHNDFKFNFENCRIEYVESGESTFCDVDFGTILINNCSYKLGAISGGSMVNFYATNRSTLFFKNTSFPVYITLACPVFDDKSSYDGYINSQGIVIDSCTMPRLNNISFFYKKNNTLMTINDVMLTNELTKSINIINSIEYGGYNSLDYEIKPNYNHSNTIDSDSSLQKTITISNGGVSVAKDLYVPPYQIVDSIYISMSYEFPPSTFTKFRIYFGEKTNNLFYEKPIYYKNTAIRNYNIFLGTAIFNQKNNKISVYIIDSSGNEVGAITSNLIIKYSRLNKALLHDLEEGVYLFTQLDENIGNIRPLGLYAGQMFYDTNIQKPIWWNESNWIDANGTTV